MSYYEAEQLTRQRRDQFVQEARGTQLMATARQTAPSRRAGRALARPINLGAALHRSAKTLLAGISWLTLARRS